MLLLRPHVLKVINWSSQIKFQNRQHLFLCTTIAGLRPHTVFNALINPLLFLYAWLSTPRVHPLFGIGEPLAILRHTFDLTSPFTSRHFLAWLVENFCLSHTIPIRHVFLARPGFVLKQAAMIKRNGFIIRYEPIKSGRFTHINKF